MENLRLVFQNLFSNTIDLLRLEVLGIGISYLELFLGVAVLGVLLTLIGHIFGFQFQKNATDFIVSGFRDAGGNSKTIKTDSRFSDPDYKNAFNQLTERERNKGVNI